MSVATYYSTVAECNMYLLDLGQGECKVPLRRVDSSLDEWVPAIVGKVRL